MMSLMNKPADDVIEQVRKLPADQRQRVIATLVEDYERELDTDGVRDEIRRRALHAVAHPEEGLPAEAVMADARAAVAAVRARRK